MYEAILADEPYCNDIRYLDILPHKGTPFLPSDQLIQEAVPIIGHRNYQIYKLIKLVCVLSFVYLMAGSGWDATIPQEIFLITCGLILFTWWILKDYLIILISCKKSKRLQICIYCLIPWRILSRCWGKLAAMHTPKILRKYIYGGYCFLFGVNMDEIQHPLNHYPTLVAFFTRKLKENSRVITPFGCLIVPCDGTLVHCGPILGKQIRQVKGLDYHINGFLGHQPTLHQSTDSSRLYQCVLYLAPGDYHRFHSPCDWTVSERAHFHGRLLSVSPIVTKWFPNLLATNERVVYMGTWQHGFFSYTAVGATNVGSITVHGDPTLTTNKRRKRHKDHVDFDEPLRLRKGEEMGYFSMGSSVVLIFEAPPEFRFSWPETNTRVKLGALLGDVTGADADTAIF